MTVPTYCSEKFSYMSVNISRHSLSACCAADAEQIDYEWLTNNPGQLFNTTKLISERTAMLANQPVPSCNSCYKSEANGQPSRRTVNNAAIKTCSNVISTPVELNIVFGNDCNMSCHYCSRTYSSAWAKDIQKNGDYNVPHANDMYQLGAKDKLLLKINQQTIVNNKVGSLLLAETIKLIPQAKSIHITGGEPFLSSHLVDILEHCNGSQDVVVFSGLGVSLSRLQKVIESLKSKIDFTVCISGENVAKNYEFTRYGNTYENYVQNLQYLIDNKIPLGFSNTISNLTLFGLNDFHAQHKEIISASRFMYLFVSNPGFLAPNIMDQASKQRVLESMTSVPSELVDDIQRAILAPATELQKIQLSSFLREYTRRRNLDTNIFPNTFNDWINE